MALPILDGNQTAATLSTVLTSGEHIPAHTVVSLGSQAITDVRSAVSGSVVSVSNFPASQSTTFGAVTGSISVLNFPSTQTVAGTVTANANVASIPISAFPSEWISGGDLLKVDLSTIYDVSPATWLQSGGGNVPISGTVTANGGNFASATTNAPSHAIQLGWNEALYGYGFRAVNNDGDELPVRPIGAVEVGTLPAISGTVTIGNSVTIGSLPAISGTVTVGNSVTIGSFATSVTARLINPAGTAVTYAEVGTAGSPSIDVLSVQGVSGGTSLPISGTAGSLTTRFGSVTTAGTAQISSAVTNASRRYLLIQNVTTSSNVITVGIGFTPTTTQGIQLSAGAGITFESSYIPTGGVYILSSVTASPFTILEA